MPRGATYGVIGPSGAGKTTAIRMIMSILFPDSGELTVLGKASALEAKDRIGYLPEERGVYRKMQVGAFLVLHGPAEGRARRGGDGARLAPARRASGWPTPRRRSCEDLSKGMLQRVQFVGAIINQPDLLILDEPFSGLDPVSVRLLKELIADEHRRGATILFSTHIMAHAEEMCQHVVMIHKGRKVLDEPMAGPAAPVRHAHDPARAARSAAPTLSVAARPAGRRARRASPTTAARSAWSRGPTRRRRFARIASVVAPARIELARVRLEDVFIRLVTEGDGDRRSEHALRANLQGLGTEGATV